MRISVSTYLLISLIFGILPAISMGKDAAACKQPPDCGGDLIEQRQAQLRGQVSTQPNGSKRQPSRDVAVTLPLNRMQSPIPGATLSSNFGMRIDPFSRRRAMHHGIDFAMPSGTPVRAAQVGKVTFVGRNGGYGLMVEIRHPNGLTTRYAHLKMITARVGQNVTRGHMIGRVGSTGRSTGPHLHFEVLNNGRQQNPMRFLQNQATLRAGLAK